MPTLGDWNILSVRLHSTDTVHIILGGVCSAAKHGSQFINLVDENE